MKFFTCPGAASGKNFRVMVPNLVSMTAFVAAIFLISFGVSFFTACWAYPGAPAMMLKIITKSTRYFFMVHPPLPETHGYYSRNVLFYQKHQGMSNKTWTGGEAERIGYDAKSQAPPAVHCTMRYAFCFVIRLETTAEFHLRAPE